MLDETAAIKAEGDKNKDNELRIRENLSNTLSRKFVEVVKEYQCVSQTYTFPDVPLYIMLLITPGRKKQQDYKDDVKKKVSRQVRIVKEDATDAEIDEVMHTAGGADRVLESAILRSAADPVREAFEKAQDKYRFVETIFKIPCNQAYHNSQQ
jgi:t-SNARE complex subunit (syntaxin)